MGDGRRTSGTCHGFTPPGALSWGSIEETAYAIHALRTLQSKAFFTDEARGAVIRARAYLSSRIEERKPDDIWIGKESYTPIKIARTIVISALLSTA
jgi:hypothetical protein